MPSFRKREMCVLWKCVIAVKAMRKLSRFIEIHWKMFLLWKVLVWNNMLSATAFDGTNIRYEIPGTTLAYSLAKTFMKKIWAMRFIDLFNTIRFSKVNRFVYNLKDMFHGPWTNLRCDLESENLANQWSLYLLRIKWSWRKSWWYLFFLSPDDWFSKIQAWPPFLQSERSCQQTIFGPRTLNIDGAKSKLNQEMIHSPNGPLSL